MFIEILSYKDLSCLDHGVFAKKLICKYTQFGPLEGIYRKQDFKIEDNKLELFLEIQSGQVVKLDTSNQSKHI